MRIGILTFHKAHNYGAVLQCYALQKFIEAQGHKVYVIDYSNELTMKCYKVWDIERFRTKNPILLLKKLKFELKLHPYRKKRFSNFVAFINKRLNLLQYTQENIDSLDRIVIGSDQVWNTKLTYGFDKMYWGCFPHSKKCKIISYAASIEEYWEQEEDVTVKNLLNNFSAISVRERIAKDVLENRHIVKNIDVVVDPTLLLNKEDWSELAIRPKINKPYLLLYQVRASDKALRIAEELSKRKNLKLIVLSASISKNNSPECITASPEEFLGWFKYASFVVCTSFHGSIFSILFEKDFYSIRLKDGKDERVESLLNTLKLESRFITCESLAADEGISYEEVRGCIQKTINPSLGFIHNRILL